VSCAVLGYRPRLLDRIAFLGVDAYFEDREWMINYMLIGGGGGGRIFIGKGLGHLAFRSKQFFSLCDNTVNIICSLSCILKS
jgi:hypothetical protein